jgi:hypothetical protein
MNLFFKSQQDLKTTQRIVKTPAISLLHISSKEKEKKTMFIYKKRGFPLSGVDSMCIYLEGKIIVNKLSLWDFIS